MNQETGHPSERERIADELAGLTAEAAAVSAELLAITRRAEAQDWEVDQYLQARAPLQEKMARLRREILTRMNQLDRLPS